MKLTDVAFSSSKFERNHPRQKAITDAIAKMIVKDIQPAYTVERQGFRELVALLEPRYTMVSRQCLQNTLLPSYYSKVEEAIQQALERIGTCSITLDIWSSRRMHSYLGVTCHFVSEMWEVKSLLIACSQIHGRHTSENIVSEFEEIVTRHKISDKLYKVVTDNASNVKKAFPDTVSMPSFEIEAESEESEQEDEGTEETDSSDDEDEAVELEKINIPQRVSCFAHTMQLSVKDGLKACSGISKVLAKAARIVNHVKKSTVATEKVERLYGKTLVSKNETRWNSQLKMVRRLTEIDVDKVVDRRDCT